LENHSEAIRHYDRVIEIDQKYSWAWHAKGLALYYSKRYDDAIVCYGKAMDADPSYIYAWNDEGNAFYKKNNYDEAIKCYDKAIEVNPNDTFAWNNKGVILIEKKKYNDAIKCFDRALEIDPDNNSAWCNKGDSLQIIGNYSEAERCYSEVIQRLKNIENLSLEDEINLTETLIKVGRYREGREYALQILNKTQNIVYQCGIRFCKLSSYLIEGDVNNGTREFAEFLKYYKSLNADFKIEDVEWDFRGLINVISRSRADLQTRFILLTLIDLMQGRIERGKFSFLHHKIIQEVNCIK
jgi:tetratricopeptide (TPR) repeat protein